MSEEKKLETPATTSAEQKPAQTEEELTLSISMQISTNYYLLSSILSIPTKKSS